MFYVVAMVASNMNGLLVLRRKISIWRFYSSSCSSPHRGGGGDSIYYADRDMPPE